MFKKSKYAIYFIAIQTTITPASAVFAMQNGCTAQSAATVTPVIELYTSEGCSSCPPADKWLSTLKTKEAAQPSAVIQAFHVGYWDYIGWVDRFATPAHTQRQKQISAWNKQNGIYTPQMVLNGKDWRGWGSVGPFNTPAPASKELAKSTIRLQQTGVDQFEATISPVSPVADPSGQTGTAVWSAYWTVTEHGHSSKVKAGENNGETLLHDYVVRQYTPVGDYAASAPQKLSLRSVAATPGHARQVNLVVFDPKTGKTIQAVSANCSS